MPQSRFSRRLVSLSPEAARAAEELAELAGVQVEAFIEQVLFELRDVRIEDAELPAEAPNPISRPPTGRVVSIEEARRAMGQRGPPRRR